MQTHPTSHAPAAGPHSRMPSRRAILRGVWALTLLVVGATAVAQTPDVLPEQFLRGYDPITVVYPVSVGPPGGGPMDGPSRYLALEPDLPGEYRWIDERTARFFPAAPWPVLSHVTVSADGARSRLFTFMEPPMTISPQRGSANLEPIDGFTLSFAGPLDPADLARMIRIELRPLPGIAAEDAVFLQQGDYRIKERGKGRNQSFEYRIELSEPIDYGTYVMLHVRLSLDETVDANLARYGFSTKDQFRLTGMGSARTLLPVSLSGSSYGSAQAVDFGTSPQPVVLHFSERIATPTVAQVREAVRFSPAVRSIRHDVSGNQLRVYFDADRNREYRVEVDPTTIRSAGGREAAAVSETAFAFYLRSLEPFVQWGAGRAILERYGPQVLPMEGRGTERIDLRVHPIDPLDRQFWPYPDRPVVVDERSRPPFPGEEEDAEDVASRIRLLGSPPVSRLVDLPISENSGRSTFGLDLAPLFAEVSGKRTPGAYLVGYRAIAPDSQRQWVRVQLTDLALTTVEGESTLTFVVTSLSSGMPVFGAYVTVEALEPEKDGEAPEERRWRPVVSGITDVSGRFVYRHAAAVEGSIRRIVVRKGEDMLVLDPNAPPPLFMDNHWYGSHSSWLEWLARDPAAEKAAPRERGYIVSERPVYRPGETVYLVGYVRNRQAGEIVAPATGPRVVSVRGPGGKRWDREVKLGDEGQFSLQFAEAEAPTGSYVAAVRGGDGHDLAGVPFRLENYRIPRFEVQLFGPDRTRLDEAFDITLTADYYAGGRVVGQSVAWQITRYPYEVGSARYPGFVFATFERFSAEQRRRSRGSDARRDVTDEHGAAVVRIDPVEQNLALPTRYLVEATVRGADSQTVTAMKQILVLPAFSIGIKQERFVPEDEPIRPEVLVLDHRGEPMAGQGFTLRLYQRQWHSYLVETDITTGEAKYVSDVVDEQLLERELVSEPGPLPVELPVSESGVYVVELIARDKAGRVQTVRTDLYRAGDSPVAWKRTDGNVFETTVEAQSYAPGDEAVILIQSPYQDARALVIVEGATHDDYSWVSIRGGQGIVRFPIHENMVPQVPVHILVLRGRVPGTGTRITAQDRGRPSTMGNTTWVTVQPVRHELALTLAHEEKKQPGETLTIDLSVQDYAGSPVDGSVALWLVDRAVLALGEERFGNPLSSFIDPARSYVRARDTRNLVVGNIPVQEIPGGGAGEAMRDDQFFRTTVRRNVKTTPFFDADIDVENGRASVQVPLPDNLTEFAARAIAVSGFHRFGTARSRVAVRLPVIVQSALPRFIRPGDRANFGGVARVVEGPGGEARAQLRVTGLVLPDGSTQTSRSLTLARDRAERLGFDLARPREAAAEQATIALAVERRSDGAGDAFEVAIPVRPDATPRFASTVESPARGETVALDVTDARPGSVTQTAVITYEPALTRMLSGLRQLTAYPYGCTEQRLSALSGALQLQRLLGTVGLPSELAPAPGAVEALLRDIPAALDAEGLVSFWPGSRGYVSLTAWTLEFVVLAAEHGYSVDPDLRARLERSLSEALRSDYRRFISRRTTPERVEAFYALARAGSFDEAYGRTLLEASVSAGLYTRAKLYNAFALTGRTDEPGLDELAESLFRAALFRMRNGTEAFRGFEGATASYDGRLLITGMRSTIEATRALASAAPEDRRVDMIVDWVVEQAGEDGWGSTANNAAVIAGLSTLVDLRSAGRSHRFTIRQGGDEATVRTGESPVTTVRRSGGSPFTVTLTSPAGDDGPEVWLYADYLPRAGGHQVAGADDGFAVGSEMSRVRDNRIAERMIVEQGGSPTFSLDEVVEQRVTVSTTQDREFVAVRVPIAAGFEPLNPNLATAPPEATPSGSITRAPDYSVYGDDHVTFYYDVLPRGTYEFSFRTRASFVGTYTLPPAYAELMYQREVRGNGPGSRVVIRESS